MKTDKELREKWHRYVYDELLKISYQDAEKLICDFWLSHRQADREMLRKEIEGMKKHCEICDNHEIHDIPYNQALTDILSLITNRE